jgi:hypothetical protein
MDDKESKCGCVCHKMSGVFIVLFGLTFLLRALGVVGEHTAAIIWPVIVILAGLKKSMRGMCKCCDKA